MNEIYELKEMLMKELEEYGAKGELTSGSLEVIDKLSHAIKNLCKIIEAAEEEEYSMADGSYDGGSYARGGGRGGNRGGSYRGGSYRGSYDGSYARGDGRSRRGGNNPTGRNQYSRESGYSRADAVEEVVETIQTTFDKLPPNLQRDAQAFVKKLEQQMM